MSTRRARIKGITALPPRRKNADLADNKSKPISSKDAEKTTRSPRTPRSIEKTERKSSPRPPPPLLPICSSPKASKLTLNSDKSLTPSENETTKVAEKISVITSVAKHSVFVSPQLRHSPTRRIASPIVPSPKLLKSSDYKFTPPHKITHIEDNELQKRGHNNEKSPFDAVDNKSDVLDDYNVPSIPESVTEDSVMDGIVALQSTRTVPKPIDQLKNEIISENAEVLFDPIIPLPSPSKIRPKKLRPVPRLGPHRRNSIQGSASESEDESRRALLSGGGTVTPAPPRQRHDSHTSHSTLQSVPPRDMNRIRNDSICSSASQLAAQPLPPATSPVKEKHVPKSRRLEMSRRMSAMRRRHENVQRDKLTMYDLIFYNPTTNPIVPNQDEIRAIEANEVEAAKIKDKKEEEEVDDPPELNDAPVPQIKLGPNGEIILDEQSLVIKQTDSKRKLSAVVHEGSWSKTGGKYTRAPRTGEWSEAETVRFYRALAAIGTDFMLMAPLFPDRNRKDLYLKFKKEERVNCAQVDKALRSVTRWDVSRLLEEFTTERAEAAQRKQREAALVKEARRAERERALAAKELAVRQSRSSKALGTSVMPNEDQDTGYVDDLLERAIEIKKPNRRVTRNNVDDLLERAIEIKKPHRRVTRNNPETVDFATLKLLSGNNAKGDAVEGLNAEVPDNQSVSSDRAELTPQTPQLTTLTLINNQMRPPATIDKQMRPPSRPGSIDMATITRVDPKTPVHANINVPSNIEAGSLVVLTVNDPKSPSKKMLQTYIARGPGQLTPVALPPTFLNSVMGYMKKGTPKSNVSAGSSPLINSPSSIASEDSRHSATPSVIQLNPSPAKRQRHSSYTITPL